MWLATFWSTHDGYHHLISDSDGHLTAYRDLTITTAFPPLGPGLMYF